jgi:hypothetical protein
MAPAPGVIARQVARLEQRLCSSCRECLPACDAGGLIWVAAEGELLIDPWNCTGCGDCVRACPTDALSLATVSTR